MDNAKLVYFALSMSHSCAGREVLLKFRAHIVGRDACKCNAQFVEVKLSVYRII